MKSDKPDDEKDTRRETLRKSARRAADHAYIERVLEDARLYYVAWCRYRETLKNPPIENIDALDVARILESFLHFVIDIRHTGVSFEPFNLMKYYKKQKGES